MNLNDRIALILGRTIIRAEEATGRAELAEEKLKLTKELLAAKEELLAQPAQKEEE